MSMQRVKSNRPTFLKFTQLPKFVREYIVDNGYYVSDDTSYLHNKENYFGEKEYYVSEHHINIFTKNGNVVKTVS